MSKTRVAASGTLPETAARKMRAVDGERPAMLYARIAAGTAFLSEIGCRFGLCGKNIGYGDFSNLVDYTTEVDWFMPTSFISVLVGHGRPTGFRNRPDCRRVATLGSPRKRCAAGAFWHHHGKSRSRSSPRSTIWCLQRRPQPCCRRDSRSANMERSLSLRHPNL